MEESHIRVCKNVIEILRKHPKSMYFVGPALDTLSPEEKKKYMEIIKEPRDFGMISGFLDNKKYSSISEFSKDLDLCFENSKRFCKENYKNVYRAACELKREFHNYIDREVSDLKNSSAKTGALLSSASSVPIQVPVASSAVSGKGKSLRVSSQNLQSSMLGWQPDTTFSFVDPCLKLLQEQSRFKLAEMFSRAVDSNAFPDYSLRIPNPADFASIRNALDRRKILSPEEFALSMRRVFANCLRYNFHQDQRSLRSDVRKMLQRFESDWATAFPGKFPPLPECKECLLAVEEVFKLQSSAATTGLSLPALKCQNFIDPVHVYFAGKLPDRYNEFVTTPMDLGTVISGVVEGFYSNASMTANGRAGGTGVAGVRRDVELIARNCEAYWRGVTNGALTPDLEELIKDAKAVKETFLRYLDNNVSERSTPGNLVSASSAQLGSAPVAAAIATSVAATSSSSSAKKKKPPGSRSEGGQMGGSPPDAVRKPVQSARPSVGEPPQAIPSPAPLPVSAATGPSGAPRPAPRRKINLREGYLRILSELGLHYVVGKWENRVFTAEVFRKTVDPTKYPDYYQIIENPISLQRIERNVKADFYGSAAAFYEDMKLLRNNAHAYNTGEAGVEIRILADKLLVVFEGLLRRFLREVMQCGDDALISKTIPESLRPFLGQQDDADTTKWLEMRDRERAAEKKASSASSSSASSLVGTIAKKKEAPTLSGAQCTGSLKVSATAPPSDSSLSIPVSVPKTAKIKLKLESSSSAGGLATGSGAALSLERKTSDFAASGAATETGFPDSSTPTPVVVSVVKAGKGKGKSMSKSLSRPIAKMATAAQPTIPRRAPEDVGGAATEFAPGSLEDSCLRVLRKVKEHEYVRIRPISEDVDRVRTVQTYIANFFVPVVQEFPGIADEYLRVVSCPMDLTTVEHVITSRGLCDADDFYDKIMLVFSNAVLFNKDDEDLVRKCKLLMQYIQWLSLELLPLKNDAGAPNPEALGPLRESVRDTERSKRVQLINPAALDTRAATKLLKVFEQRKSRKEYEYFSRPVNNHLVPNYSMYVRKPMDFQTLRKNMEQGTYRSNEAFLTDLRRIFTNALDFNGVFKDTDPASKMVFTAAQSFIDKLDHKLFSEFSVEAAERLMRSQIARTEEQKKIEELRQQRLEREALEAQERERNASGRDLAFGEGRVDFPAMGSPQYLSDGGGALVGTQLGEGLGSAAVERQDWVDGRQDGGATARWKMQEADMAAKRRAVAEVAWSKWLNTGEPFLETAVEGGKGRAQTSSQKVAATSSKTNETHRRFEKEVAGSGEIVLKAVVQQSKTLADRQLKLDHKPVKFGFTQSSGKMFKEKRRLNTSAHIFGETSDQSAAMDVEIGRQGHEALDEAYINSTPDETPELSVSIDEVSSRKRYRDFEGEEDIGEFEADSSMDAAAENGARDDSSMDVWDDPLGNGFMEPLVVGPRPPSKKRKSSEGAGLRPPLSTCVVRARTREVILDWKATPRRKDLSPRGRAMSAGSAVLVDAAQSVTSEDAVTARGASAHQHHHRHHEEGFSAVTISYDLESGFILTQLLLPLLPKTDEHSAVREASEGGASSAENSAAQANDAELYLNVAAARVEGPIRSPSQQTKDKRGAKGSIFGFNCDWMVSLCGGEGTGSSLEFQSTAKDISGSQCRLRVKRKSPESREMGHSEGRTKPRLLELLFDVRQEGACVLGRVVTGSDELLISVFRDDHNHDEQEYFRLSPVPPYATEELGRNTNFPASLFSKDFRRFSGCKDFLVSHSKPSMNAESYLTVRTPTGRRHIYEEVWLLTDCELVAETV